MTLSACQLDLQVKDLSSDGALAIVADCPKAVYQTKAYVCSLSLKGSAKLTPTLMSSTQWFLAPENTCSWASIAPSSGVVSGVPQPTASASCQLSFYAIADGQSTATVSLPISVKDLVSSVGGLASGVTVLGNYAYVAKLYRGLETYDISDPTTPSLVGFYPLAETNDLVIKDKYAYIANDSEGLFILDISDPTNPTLAGSYDTAGRAEDVILNANHAYVGDGTNGLVVVDTTDPTNPAFAGAINSGPLYGVAIHGKHAYLARAFGGLDVVDITDPTNPSLIDNYDIPGSCSGLVIYDNHAFVASASFIVRYIGD